MMWLILALLELKASIRTQRVTVANSSFLNMIHLNQDCLLENRAFTQRYNDGCNYSPRHIYRNNNFHDYSTTAGGAGINIAWGTNHVLEFYNNRFNNIKGASGTAIYLKASKAEIIGNSFSNLQSEGYAAIHCDDNKGITNFTLINNTFKTITAKKSGGGVNFFIGNIIYMSANNVFNTVSSNGDGGGINFNSAISIDAAFQNDTFIKANSKFGGGIRFNCRNGNINMYDCNFEDCNGGGTGGGAMALDLLDGGKVTYNVNLYGIHFKKMLANIGSIIRMRYKENSIKIIITKSDTRNTTMEDVSNPPLLYIAPETLEISWTNIVRTKGVVVRNNDRDKSTLTFDSCVFQNCQDNGNCLIFQKWFEISIINTVFDTCQCIFKVINNHFILISNTILRNLENKQGTHTIRASDDGIYNWSYTNCIFDNSQFYLPISLNSGQQAPYQMVYSNCSFYRMPTAQKVSFNSYGLFKDCFSYDTPMFEVLDSFIKLDIINCSGTNPNGYIISIARTSHANSEDYLIQNCSFRVNSGNAMILSVGTGQLTTLSGCRFEGESQDPSLVINGKVMLEDCTFGFRHKDRRVIKFDGGQLIFSLEKLNCFLVRFDRTFEVSVENIKNIFDSNNEVITRWNESNNRCFNYIITDSFTESYYFDGSVLFTNSGMFSFSSYFQPSSVFLRTNDFSRTIFTMSNKFSHSSFLSITNEFDKTNNFMNSQIFPKSTDFSRSNDLFDTNSFSKSQNFDESEVFSITAKFDDSSIFSTSINFLESTIFSETSQFQITDSFNESRLFSNSKEMEMTFDFSLTQEFHLSKEYSRSSNFVQTDDFSVSYFFECTKQMSQSKNFDVTNGFSESSIFVQTDHLSQSDSFFTSKEFSTSLGFIESAIFSCSNSRSESQKLSDKDDDSSQISIEQFSSSDYDNKDDRETHISTITQTIGFESSETRENIYKDSHFSASNVETVSQQPTTDPKNDIFSSNYEKTITEADNTFESSYILSDHVQNSLKISNSNSIPSETYFRENIETSSSVPPDSTFFSSTKGENDNNSQRTSSQITAEKQLFTSTQHVIASMLTSPDSIIPSEKSTIDSIYQDDKTLISSEIAHNNEANIFDSSKAHDMENSINSLYSSLNHESVARKKSDVTIPSVFKSKFDSLFFKSVRVSSSTISEFKEIDRHDRSSYYSIIESSKSAVPVFTEGSEGNDSKDSNVGVIVGTVVAIIAIIVIIVVIVYFLVIKKKNQSNSLSYSLGESIDAISSFQGSETTADNVLFSGFTDDDIINGSSDYTYEEMEIAVENDLLN